MKQQTAIGKAFAINKDPGIYGSFAEIGAGQETVNHFFKAGLASQTVAKSMSAYDMTFSDEIYGKQSRYVSKSRLLTMLNHEYKLIERRLMRKRGKNSRFFAFAATAATGALKRKAGVKEHHHAWMGIRFQEKPLSRFNDIVFHVNCLDRSRLQQYGALGSLGVNLIYACFHHRGSPREFARSLTDSLPPARLEIKGMSCSGPALKAFSPAEISLELLRQKASPLALFRSPEQSEMIGDAVFGKPVVVFYGPESFLKEAAECQAAVLKALGLSSEPVFAAFAPFEGFKTGRQLESRARAFCRRGLRLLLAPSMNLEKLKDLLIPYSQKPIIFAIPEEGFAGDLFNPSKYSGSLLKSLGVIFDSGSKAVVLSKNKGFSLKSLPLPSRGAAGPPAAPAAQAKKLRDYLIEKKQLLACSPRK